MSSKKSTSGRVPARLAPIFVPRIWGARSLAALFPHRSHEADPIGEVWLTGDECKFATGPFAGRSLGEVWPELPQDWTGTRVRGLSRIPLLIKFIFPEDKLSVQVHPDDAYAAEHEAEAGGLGKTEMWYMVEAQPGAALLVGLRPGVTRESFQRAIAEGTAEDCLASVPVRAGDAVFVPAGTAHTICPGVVLCEIQEHSDITYRVFDYNRLGTDGRPRTLHIRQAVEVMNFGEQKGGLCDPVRAEQGALEKMLYAVCQHFATERWQFRKSIAASTSADHFELLIFLGGKGQIEFAEGKERYGPAEVWLFPARLGEYQLVPDSETTLLRTYVPDLKDFAEKLDDQHMQEPALARVVHS